ncbi:uncharacterized protein MKZ38_009221 [Zalerion maritima]|uniref:Uncharacterized protein n=1 Tax=Zalerion maritima TaxID=339359 RepID=A0AAD5RGP1_9PEZI|nr:uncharacterized protein MKZ38_009221 [Zalerion maritima]
MHHSRRKSGHGSANTSMTDVRKATSTHHHHDTQRKSKSNRNNRVMMSPSTSSAKLGKNPRDREREWEEEHYYEDDSATFPQFCMSCEKQFFPQDERILYCSENCRRSDQNAPTIPYASSSSSYYGAGSPAPVPNYPYYAAEQPGPRDIVPRASPSRPTSTHFASPPSPPELPHTYHHSSALSALRSLNLNGRPPSPPSPGASGSGGLWPFSSSGRSTTTSPSSSYTRSNSGFFSSTYDAAYAYPNYPTGTDRPLPSRRPGAGYSRPKSIELVTPMIGR